MIFKPLYCKFLLKVEEKVIRKPQTSLSFHEIRSFASEINFYNFLQVILWLLSVFLTLAISQAQIAPSKFILNNVVWMSFLENYYHLLIAFLFLDGFYVAVVHESFYVYVILHNHFQMHLLARNLRNKMADRRSNDQNQMRSFLLEVIQQYQKLDKFGFKEKTKI